MMRKNEKIVKKQRQLILNAALITIAEKKISGATMRDIAERAGISHGTLHYHYPSKIELLHALLDEIDLLFNEDRAGKIASQNLNPSAALREFLSQEERLLKQQRHVVEAFIDFWGHGHKDAHTHTKIQSMYSKWRQDIETVLLDGIKRGEFDRQAASFIPGIMVSLMEGSTLQYLIDKEAFDLEAYFSLAYEMIMQILVDAPINREPYPTDLKDKAWVMISPLLLSSEKTAGRPRSVDLREIVNAILYLTQAGCSWRMLPHDFPHWKTVHGYFNKWVKDGTLARISTLLDIELNQSVADNPGNMA